MASPWCSSSRAVAAEALSKHVHRSDYRETAKRRLERHLSQRRQATVEAKAWRRGGWWWWCGCCGLGDGFEEKKLGQNSKLTANCSKLCNIFFDFVYDLSTFLAHVYSVCNITNICSQKKICRMARMAQNIMSRWGSAGSRRNCQGGSANDQVSEDELSPTTKSRRSRYGIALPEWLQVARSPQRTAEAEHKCKPGIPERMNLMKGGQRDLRLGIGKRAFLLKRFTCASLASLP